MTDPRDEILHRHTPVIMVPAYGELAPLEVNGHRYLAATDGLWIEVRRPWLHMRAIIAESKVPMPFGTVEHSVTYAFDTDDIDVLLQRFEEEAIAALPAEHAAWGLWDDSTRQLVYAPVVTLESTEVRNVAARPRLQGNEHLAVDIHSHGLGPAGFSTVDDEDDEGEVKISIVVGSLDRRRPTYAIRLCAMGLFNEVNRG